MHGTRKRREATFHGSLALATVILLLGIPANWVTRTTTKPWEFISEQRNSIRVEVNGPTQIEGIYELPGGTTTKAFLATLDLDSDGGVGCVPNEVLARPLEDLYRLVLEKGPRGVEIRVTTVSPCKAFLLGAPMDLNKAGVWDLTLLPGVGPVLARRIVNYRERQGLFRSAEELIRVKGISTKTLQKIQPVVKATAEMPGDK